MTGLRLAQRNDSRAQMTAIADSELEWLFFSVKTAIMAGSQPTNLSLSAWVNTQADLSETPSTMRDAHSAEHRTTGWRVQRSIRHLLSTEGIDTSTGGSRIARLDYIEAKIVILPPLTGPLSGLPPVRIGRYFEASQSSIFQYGVFFDGDLELNPGEDYTINGDIYTNGNAFLAPLAGKSLIINANAKLRLITGKTLNGATAANLVANVAGSVKFNPVAPPPPVSFGDPLFGLTGTGAPGTQLEYLLKEENLLGGADALATARARPDLFGPFGRTNPLVWTAADIKVAEQNVKRSLIAPPPSVASAFEYPNNPSSDNPTISVQRAYNRAQIIVTVDTLGAITVETRNSDNSLSNTTLAFNGILPANPLVPAVATTVSGGMFDTREGANVAITEINVAALKDRLELSGAAFNGLIYINLKNASSSSPAAVRVINGESVPASPGGLGLSIATNGGLYVKGSFNITPIPNTTTYPTSMLMADAITVLSYAWDDTKAAAPVVAGRVASVNNPLTTLVTESAVSINAGLITGNSVSTSTHSSGGAQNLVRFLENWAGQNVNFLGSLGRVFNSRVMDSPFIGPSTVYRAPMRAVTYDDNLAKRPPAGSPNLPGFSRGDIFRF